MKVRIVVVSAVVAVACGPLSPQEEARAFLLDVVACLEDNRDELVEAFINSDESLTVKQLAEDELPMEQVDELCDGLDSGALSEAAKPLVEEAGRAAFAKVLPALLGSALASAFAGGDGFDQAAANGMLDGLVEALRDEAEAIQAIDQ